MKSIRTHQHLRHRRRRATALLEFVLILPLFLFLTLFIIDASRMLFVKGAMSDVSYRTARAGAVVGGAGTATSGPSRTAFDAAVVEVPGADSAERLTLQITRGQTCTVADPYVAIDVSFRLRLLTPGLAQLLDFSTGSTTGSSGALASGQFEMSSSAIARCEVVP
jgi:Flp pilus assembly protein TadG